AGSVLSIVAPGTRGTCGDERERVGLLSGEPTVEVRPSVWGGPNIYGLYMAELAGFFDIDDKSTGRQRLQIVTDVLNAAKIPSGGHTGCAANGSLPAVMGLVANEFTKWSAAAQTELGVQYDQTDVYQITHQAQQAIESKRYQDWQEDILFGVLGEEAATAIEVLQPSAVHDGRSVLRIETPGKTVGQTQLSQATNGERSFVQTEWYCQQIEDALVAASSNAQIGLVMRHAREALLWAVEQAVPNNELHHIALR
ncbi:MAG: hypothetical protein ABI221_01040, partial [Candidatus Saccharimonadales bacterium]